jgi:hypothetical protein
MLARQDDKSAEKLRAEYLAYTAAEIDHCTGLHKHVWPGHSPRDVVSLESAQRRFDEPASGYF